ncbi:amino acid ABC transporter substrate-binding protein (PAAT family) /amino acid ABC transporter membrane protein (PAAT family) [Breznakia blatticola]|uniref:Amino acid ABC transporter substrate-binding protein (PAAT family) /amino acid ABC transporter membrane protein (PAAT family) n=1 Tax=Breznakia blatticola TaxID=1754012 RepID=A0A4R7ZCE6_9FIRM|nr:amino acid ABC transporter substrate-binding protein (PAAT family) /amino acid ABC transporter membrane protein (PAAT family) [Breznakia blatticola]
MKKLRLGFLCLFALAMLVGCQEQKARVNDENTFVVGMECNYTPFNWQTMNATDTSVSIGGAGYCDGYDVMIAQNIADKLGQEIEIKKLSWEGLLPALESGEIDAIIAGMTADETREKGIDFTTPYYESEMVMITRGDGEEASYDDIQQFGGKNIIGQKSTNYDTVIDQIENVQHATPKATYPEMVVALQKHEVDGITAELPVAQGVVASNPDLTIVHFAEDKGFDIDTSVSIGLKEGSRGAEFYEKVQKALDEISDEQRVGYMESARKNQPETGEPTDGIAIKDQGFFAKVTNIAKEYWPLFAYGVQITLILAFVGTLFGLLIGLLLGTLRSFTVEESDSLLVKICKKISHAFVGFYVWVLRGTPMMVQAFFLYYLLKPILQWTPLTAGMIIISVNTGAYMAEIIRSGIQSIDKGQTEGARSIGMTNLQTMMFIILPQAIKNQLPSIGNQLIVNIKDSSMLNVIGVVDLYFQSTSVAGSVYQFSETFFVTSLVYLFLTTIATVILNLIEKRMGHPKTLERGV